MPRLTETPPVDIPPVGAPADRTEGDPILLLLLLTAASVGECRLTLLLPTGRAVLAPDGAPVRMTGI
jgi:hypothetical protein